MLMWILAIACAFGLHRGGWNYVEDDQCNQTRVCRGCGRPSFRNEHDVRDWESDGFSYRTESGACVRCKGTVSRRKSHGGLKG